jgi:hypothetical protein
MLREEKVYKDASQDSDGKVGRSGRERMTTNISDGDQKRKDKLDQYERVLRAYAN